MNLLSRINKRLDDLSVYAVPLLRYGLALVYLAFAIWQFIDPYNFIGYLPGFLFSSGYAIWFIYANALFELICAILLIVGFGVRFVSFLLGLHLLAITIELGFGLDAIRDFGLMIATFALMLFGNDTLCISRKEKSDL
jgi:uncharacterized membrane protein YphA (DoxX/SURF4 family)